MDLQVAGLTVAQEHGTTTTEEEHNPILPELDELIFGGLAFILVFTVLARFAMPRIRQGMAERTEKVKGDLEKAEQAKGEAERILARYEEQLRDARGEASRIIDEARKTAESMRKDLLARAEDDSRQIVARAQEEIRAERDRAFEELRSEVGKLTVDLAAKIVGKDLDKKRHSQMVDDYIDELTSRGNGS